MDFVNVWRQAVYIFQYTEEIKDEIDEIKEAQHEGTTNYTAPMKLYTLLNNFKVRDVLTTAGIFRVSWDRICKVPLGSMS